MRTLITGAACGLLLCTSTAAMAENLRTVPVRDTSVGASPGKSRVPYTFAAGRFAHLEGDNDVSANGFGIEGSYLVIPSLYAVGSLFSSQSDDIQTPSGTSTVDVNQISLGAGYRMELMSNLDLIASAQAIQIETEAFGASEDDTGYQVATGVRSLLMKDIEGRAELGYLDVGSGSGDAFLGLAGLYRFTPQLAAGLEASLSDDTTAYGIGGRWSF